MAGAFFFLGTMEERYPVLEIAEWKNKARDGEAPESVILRKYHVTDDTELKIIDSERKIRFTISTNGVDRDRDTIKPSGWNVENYLKNPVMLWAHDYSQLPVAKSVDLTVGTKRVQSLSEFPPTGVHPFADTVYDLIKFGALNATSVGFSPEEWTFDEERGGMDFIRQELLEVSIVPVPSNPEALVSARSKGINIKLVEEWIERAYHELEGHAYVPKWKLEEVLEELAPQQVSVDWTPLNDLLIDKASENLDTQLMADLDDEEDGFGEPNPDALTELVRETVREVLEDHKNESEEFTFALDTARTEPEPEFVFTFEKVEPEQEFGFTVDEEWLGETLPLMVKTAIRENREGITDELSRSIIRATTGRLD